MCKFLCVGTCLCILFNITYVKIRDVVLKTCLGRWTIERVRDIRATSTTWWWFNVSICFFPSVCWVLVYHGYINTNIDLCSVRTWIIISPTSEQPNNWWPWHVSFITDQFIYVTMLFRRIIRMDLELRNYQKITCGLITNSKNISGYN